MTYAEKLAQEYADNLSGYDAKYKNTSRLVGIIEQAMQAQREACLIAVQRPLIHGSKADIEIAIINAEVQP